MAPGVGLEPTTLRLTAECSAIELLRIALQPQPYSVGNTPAALVCYSKCAIDGQSTSTRATETASLQSHTAKTTPIPSPDKLPQSPSDTCRSPASAAASPAAGPARTS